MDSPTTMMEIKYQTSLNATASIVNSNKVKLIYLKWFTLFIYSVFSSFDQTLSSQMQYPTA